jgi:hypothetical protein
MVNNNRYIINNIFYDNWNDYSNKVVYMTLKDNLEVCIHEKLREHAIEHGKSIIDLHILYDYHIQEVSRIYRNPYEHYNKIRAIAYRKVTK